MTEDQPEPVVIGPSDVDCSPAEHTHLINKDSEPAVAILEPDKNLGRVTVQFAPCPKCKTNRRVICWMSAGTYKCNGCGLVGIANLYQRADKTTYYQLESKR